MEMNAARVQMQFRTQTKVSQFSGLLLIARKDEEFEAHLSKINRLSCLRNGTKSKMVYTERTS